MSSISNTARFGNVLVLLDLYASGFASSTASPTIPMLTSRTMHTLYAISLLVYSIDSLLNWLHIYAIIQGFLTSFPLHLWFIILLVTSTVSGSMLILLLVMLCVENAFVHRLDIAEHKSGFTVIWEALVEWLYGFNNFRIGFLFMALHDAPITLSNFFLLGSCRFSGPEVLRWPLLLSVMANSVSLCWRYVLLYYAYSRLVLPSRRKASSALPSRTQSFRNHIDSNITQMEGLRLDESWPIRWSKTIFYGETRRTKEGRNLGRGTLYLNGDSSEKLSCGFWLSWIVFRGSDLFCSILKCLFCLFSTIFLYILCFAVGFTPCLHFYFCRSNSFSHRHKCARTCVRRCTLIFHYSVFLLSVFLTLWLLFLNLVMLTSVHLIGPNNWPPEISRLCISIDPDHRSIRPFFLPETTLFSSLWPNADQSLSRFSKCKSLWDFPYPQTLIAKWAPGLFRVNPGPWQVRIPLGDGKALAVSTHFLSNYSQSDLPEHRLLYDFAVLHFGPDNSTRMTHCLRQQFSGWFFTNRLNQLDFPYFLSCSPTIRIRKAKLIDCRVFNRKQKIFL